jgi:ribonuclease HI
MLAACPTCPPTARRPVPDPSVHEPSVPEPSVLNPATGLTTDPTTGPVTDQLTTVFTDGACLGNPGPGGWAWAVPRGRYQSGPEGYTTNQRMEVRAALEAVTTITGPVEVVSDSTYVVNCFRDPWWAGWLARGWLNSAKKPVANRDLWEPLINAYRAEPGRIRFRWVKGHSNDVMNDLVDRLAVAAASSQTAASGTGVPPVLGPADVIEPRYHARPARPTSGRPTPPRTRRG